MSRHEHRGEHVRVNFTPAEKRRLQRLARDHGQTLGEYIRERVLAESSCEEQVLRFFADELTETVQQARKVLARTQPEARPQEPVETPEEQRDRIVKEVRESLTEEELDALAHFFKPAFDAGLWPAEPDKQQGDSQKKGAT